MNEDNLGELEFRVRSLEEETDELATKVLKVTEDSVNRSSANRFWLWVLFFFQLIMLSLLLKRTW